MRTCQHCHKQNWDSADSCHACNQSLAISVQTPSTEPLSQEDSSAESHPPLDPRVEILKKTCDCFFEVEAKDGLLKFYQGKDLLEELPQDLTAGTVDRQSAVTLHTQDPDDAGSWTTVKGDVSELSESHFEIKRLYEPVWTYAMRGMKWGAVGGVILMLADTFLMLAATEPSLGLLFLCAVLVCFIPKIGMLGVCMISMMMFRISEVNFFIMGLSAGLTGAILGALPGMAIGGAIGLLRCNSLASPKDLTIEDRQGNLINAFLAPLCGCTGVFALYLYVFNPWLIEVLS